MEKLKLLSEFLEIMCYFQNLSLATKTQRMLYTPLWTLGVLTQHLAWFNYVCYMEHALHEHLFWFVKHKT
jgi:hypothetical protein